MVVTKTHGRQVRDSEDLSKQVAQPVNKHKTHHETICVHGILKYTSAPQSGVARKTTLCSVPQCWPGPVGA